MILNVQEAREHLRYDEDELSDAEAKDLILSAEQAIKDYITDAFDESNYAMKRAAKLLIGWFDENRDINKETVSDGNYLPAPVRALLYKYRLPVAE